MLRRAVIGVLLAGGLLLVAVGAQKWFDKRAAEKTVHRFMQALHDGDRETALSLLTPERRQRAEESRERHLPGTWTPQSGVDYRIVEMTVRGNKAVATLRIEKQGWIIRPEIHLHQGPTARWKIARIENTGVDPRWRQMKRAVGRKQGEELSNRIKQSLKDRPGVTVERAPLPDGP